MKQRRPKSIRLTEADELRSAEIAERFDMSWHRWMVTLVRWSNAQPKYVVREINEFHDQEHCS
jgi:hypothetical protein